MEDISKTKHYRQDQGSISFEGSRGYNAAMSRRRMTRVFSEVSPDKIAAWTAAPFAVALLALSRVGLLAAEDLRDHQII